jgi:CheY-like chemotaxis protein
MALRGNDTLYEMTTFEDGEEAVNALCSPAQTANAVTLSAILLDLNTPKTDGFDVLGN